MGIARQPDFTPVHPKDLNRVIDAVNRGLDLSAAPPLEVRHFAGKTQLRLAEKGFIGAVIAEESSSSSSSSDSELSAKHKYTVQEVQIFPNGLWEYVEGGRVVTPAYEWNDTAVSVGTVVLIEPFGEDWRFDHPGGGHAEPISSSHGSSISSTGSSISSEGSSEESSEGSGDCDGWVRMVSDISCVNGQLVKTYVWIRGDFETTSDDPCPSSSA